MQRRGYSSATWHSHPLNPKTLSAETVDWIFMVDLLNFSFWTPPAETPYTVCLDGVPYTGYWSLCAAINRGLREGIPLTDPSWWVSAPNEILQHVFRSDSPAKLSMLQERIWLLRETGAILISKFGGSFRTNILEASAGSALALINTLCLNFHSFLDMSSHHDNQQQPVFLLKRAQILVADLWACFGGEGWGRFVDIDALTIFADYRIPQQLEILGLLTVSPELKERLRRGELLSVHSQEVVELRATSIWIAELLRREMVCLSQRGGQLNAVLLDFYLWDTIKEHYNPALLEREFPIHRTRSLFY